MLGLNTRRQPLVAVALAVLLAGVAASCGDDGGEPESFDEPAASSTDSEDDESEASGPEGACNLLDSETVAELLGQAVEDGTEEDIGDGATVCEWSTVEPSQVVDSPITLEVELGPLTDEVDADIDEALASPSNQVLDIGDRAFQACALGADGSSCRAYDTVTVAVGDAYVEVDLSNWGYPADYAEEEGAQIAEDAARHAVDALG